MMDVFKQQYTACMRDGMLGNQLHLSREYSKKLFGPMFYSWCNCPLIRNNYQRPNYNSL